MREPAIKNNLNAPHGSLIGQRFIGVNVRLPVTAGDSPTLMFKGTVKFRVAGDGDVDGPLTSKEFRLKRRMAFSRRGSASSG